ncbi:hypothetical protein PV336_16135 [Streptomyces sp. MI02-2A]|uniref:hypothetical protein n=1 Tax=Streptomyces sp. MI02-2A TaxID=3028688 RepID=UPI0029A1F80A|nr:hypothetical protein [Streptomyces sp. MI02-2A]MDX3260750.1 hypothetical protein [Streptomyces sp. MI02-2A]
MPDIPILGQTSEKPLNTDDLTPEQRERLAQMADENPPAIEGRKVTTAFLVVVGDDGAVEAHSNIAVAHELVLDRGATPDDIYGAASVVLKDISAMETANRTQQSMMMMGAAMQQRAQEAQLRASLGNIRG